MNTRAIIRGTTPTVRFTFGSVNPAQITDAYLVLKQQGQEVIRVEMEDAIVGEHTLSWVLTQEQTLALTAGKDTTIVCDWLLSTGVRGRSEEAVYKTGEPGIADVLPLTEGTP